jgi:Fe-S-cluster-containing dehydrogenase component
MDERRRSFLKIAGVSALGIGWAVPVVSAIGKAFQSETFEPDARALRAKRWAMVVDTQKCLRKDGCTACIDACHLVHNVPALDNPRHEVKWIWKEKYEHAFPTEVHPHVSEAIKGKPVLVFCNHCDRPPCVRVCPTAATFRRPDGIVVMDEHRCIGCRYCIAACPYGARSFNWKDPRPFIKRVVEEFPTRSKGVVEKCNFCQDRLARGLGPACVEACKKAGGDALVFGDLGNPNSEVARILRERFTIRRKPALGTSPHVFYVV